MDSAASVSPEELASQPMFQASTSDALAGETPEQQSIRQLLLRVQELTAERVKSLVEDVIRKQLGWLVVWGNVFGALIGVASVMAGYGQSIRTACPSPSWG